MNDCENDVTDFVTHCESDAGSCCGFASDENDFRCESDDATDFANADVSDFDCDVDDATSSCCACAIGFCFATDCDWIDLTSTGCLLCLARMLLPSSYLSLCVQLFSRRRHLKMIHLFQTRLAVRSFVPPPPELI